MRVVRIATRASDLARWQADWVGARLRALGQDSKLVLVETHGDRTQDENQPFRGMTGQGFFTKAVQDAVLAGDADIAVHSQKDLPSAQTPGLETAAITERADPRDVLLIRPEAFAVTGEPLPVKPGSVVGTSAARRQAQLRHLRPDLAVRELRGNVPTRVQKLREGHYHAVVLAAAGLARLGLELDDLEAILLEPHVFVPAPGQGSLALECRRDDIELASLLTDLHDRAAYRCIAAERGLMALLQGGCQLALGAHATLADNQLELTAWYEGRVVTVAHPSSEGAAYLAFDALGRPSWERA